MSAPAGVSRRGFIKTSAGLVIGFAVAPKGRLLALQAAGTPAVLPPPDAFLRIGADDTVTVLLAHSEMGQGIWTTLPMMVAEELECEWSKIRVEHAPAAPAYFHTAYHSQMTGGSTTTGPSSTGTARSALCSRDADRRRGGTVEGRAFRLPGREGFRRFRRPPGVLRLAREGRAGREAPVSVKLKDRKDWKILGKPTSAWTRRRR
jgi:isoquinoline 1-oxidoreductase beta subunit